MKQATTPTIRIPALCGTLFATLALAGCGDADSASPAPSESAMPADSAAAVGTLSEALSLSDPYARVHALAILLPTLGPEVIPELRDAIEQAMLGMGVAELELLVRTWASHDPRAAATWAFSIAAPRFQAAALDASIEVWARSDPAAATAGVSKATEDPILRELAQTVQVALMRGWFQKDRASLEQYMQGLGSGIQQQRALMAFSLALERAEGGEAVARWAEAIPDDNERYKLAAYRQVAAALAWSDPATAERWCDAQCEGPFGKSLRSAIVRMRLGNGDDGRDVVEWVSRAPEGPSRNHALGTAFEIWALRDRESAFAWMEEQMAGEPPPWLHVLFTPYARQLAASSPPDALKVAARIDGDLQREELMVRIARRWLKQDKEAAQAWLEKSPLSPAARARARNLRLPDYLPEPVTS